MIDRRSTIVTPAAEWPITVEEAKQHCRVTSNDEDALILRLIKTATPLVENRSKHVLVTQTWRSDYDSWPFGSGGLELPFPPLQSVSSIQYRDSAGTLTTWALAGNYQVQASSGPGSDRGRIEVLSTASAPTLWTQGMNLVQVTFVAGFGAAASVPDDLKSAVHFLVAEMYDRRDLTIVGTISTPNIIGYKAICDQYAGERY